jgi:hypothetical protein
VPDQFQEVLDQVNYPHVPTIYGPVCQWFFLLSYLVSPGPLWPWKLVALGAELAAVVLLLGWARTHARSSARTGVEAEAGVVLPALILGWCPLAVFETSFNAHPDIVGVAYLLGAMRCWQRSKPGAAAVASALAVASRPMAAIIVPSLLGRKGKSWAVFVASLVVIYAPFWVRGSLAEWRGLATMGVEWEFNSSLYAMVSWLLGPTPAWLLCLGLFLAFWGAVVAAWWRRGADSTGRELPPGAVLFGAFFLLSPTVNPWYLLWLVPFVALRPTGVGLTALAMVGLSYVTGLNLGHPVEGNFAHPAWVRPVEYGGVLLAALAAWFRLRPAR